MLGKLSVLGRPTSLDDSRARAYRACSRCGWGVFGHFFSHISFLFSFSLSLGDGPIWTGILSQRAVKPKTTNQLRQAVMFVYIYGTTGISCRLTELHANLDRFLWS